MNREIESLKSGIFWKSISTMINVLAGFVMSVIFARFLGKDLYGELILVYTVVTLFMLLSNFGLNAALQRFIPLYIKKKDEEKFTSFILTSVSLGILFTFLFSIIMFLMADFISIHIFHKPGLITYMRWGVLYLFTFSLFTNLVSSIYCGFQRWKEECLLNGIYFSISFLAILIALAIFHKGVVEVLKINAVIALVSISIGISHIAREVKLFITPLRLGSVISQIKETLRFSLPMLMSGFLFYLIVRVDKIILGMYRPMGELAQYYIAFSLGSGILMFIRVSETVLTPYLAKLSGEDSAVIKRKFQTIFRLFLHLPIMLLIPLYFFIEPFINFAYGPDFAVAATALKVYLVIIGLRAALIPAGLFLINVYAKTFEVTKICIITAFAHLIFYFLLIPKYGYKGVLAGTIITYIIVWSYVILFIKEINKLIPYRSLLYAGVGMAVVLGINFIAKISHIHNKLFLFIILPSVYLLFTLLKGDIELKKIRNAI